jgi:SAM-dependent methyltransferase
VSRDWDAYAPFYDWENERTFGRRDIAWWKAWALRAPRTLELGCGTGRLITPLARAGARITGVDFSAAMLDKARVRTRRLPRRLRPALVRGDIRELAFADRTFSLVLAPYGVLQSLTTDADLDATIAQVARVLKPRGTFGIDLVPDLPSWESYRKEMRLRGRLGGAGITLVESVRQDRRRGLTIFDEEFIVGAGSRARRHRFSLTFRTIAMAAFLERLTRAGFSIDGVHGDYRGGVWTPDSDAWVVMATKSNAHRRPLL